jgi:hypothetical protein
MKKGQIILAFLVAVIAITGCQKMDKPALGDYPKDINPPGGPLNFYVAFDGESSNSLRNAVDSVRANFPSDNPFTSVAGISGKAVKGVSGKFIKFSGPNDWVTAAKSFTVAFWAKGDGQTKNNSGTNGPEHIFSLNTDHGAHDWPNATMLFFEGNNTACAIKFYVYTTTGDRWLTWEGGNSIAGIRDNQWRHYAFVYNASTSSMTLYINGVANPNVMTWPGHGDIKFDKSKIKELRIGRGPRDDGDDDGASGWVQSSWKGELDQFRLYSSALSASEVQTLFNSKK